MSEPNPWAPTGAQFRFLTKVAEVGHDGVAPFGSEWRAADELLERGFIVRVIVEHLGCSIGKRRITPSGSALLVREIRARAAFAEAKSAKVGGR